MSSLQESENRSHHGYSNGSLESSGSSDSSESSNSNLSEASGLPRIRNRSSPHTYHNIPTSAAIRGNQEEREIVKPIVERFKKRRERETIVEEGNNSL